MGSLILTAVASLAACPAANAEIRNTPADRTRMDFRLGIMRRKRGSDRLTRCPWPGDYRRIETGLQR